MNLKLVPIGNSTGVRIPTKTLKELKLKKGDDIDGTFNRVRKPGTKGFHDVDEFYETTSEDITVKEIRTEGDMIEKVENKYKS